MIPIARRIRRARRPRGPRNMPRLLLTLLLTPTLVHASPAAPAPATSAEPPLTLSAAVERALGRYPAVTAARLRVAEAAEATGEVAASHGPIVNRNASALGYDDPMITILIN